MLLLRLLTICGLLSARLRGVGTLILLSLTLRVRLLAALLSLLSLLTGLRDLLLALLRLLSSLLRGLRKRGLVHLLLLLAEGVGCLIERLLRAGCIALAHSVRRLSKRVGGLLIHGLQAVRGLRQRVGGISHLL